MDVYHDQKNPTERKIDGTSTKSRLIERWAITMNKKSPMERIQKEYETQIVSQRRWDYRWARKYQHMNGK